MTWRWLIFQVHNSASLSIFTLCNCHHYPSLGNFHLSCLKFCGCSAKTSLPLCIASSRNTPTCFWAWLIPALHVKGIPQELPCCTYSDLTQHTIFKACPWCSVNQNFISYNSWMILFYIIYYILLICLSSNTHVDCSYPLAIINALQWSVSDSMISILLVLELDHIQIRFSFLWI